MTCLSLRKSRLHLSPAHCTQAPLQGKCQQVQSVCACALILPGFLSMSPLFVGKNLGLIITKSKSHTQTTVCLPTENLPHMFV